MSSIDVFIILHAVVPVPLRPIQLLYRIITVPISILPVCDISIPFNIWLRLILLWLLMRLMIVRFISMRMLICFFSFCLITILSPLIPTTITVSMIFIIICPGLIEPLIISFVLTIRSHKSTLVVSIERVVDVVMRGVM